jgi:hypothetical protein
MDTEKFWLKDLISSTFIIAAVGAKPIEVQTFLPNLTDSYSLVCGDASGNKWCGNRAPVIIFVSGACCTKIRNTCC